MDREQFDKVLKYINIGKNEGAKLVAGGEKAADKGYYVKVREKRTEDDVSWPIIGILSALLIY